jgi:ectoine hydroxylase-related dioxygenase (phytanoyl-CoA dioxygenase family)
MTKQIFTPDFDQIDPKTIADELKFGSGYYVFKQALTAETLSAITALASDNELLINNNNLGFVRTQWSKFLSYTLAVSKECYDLVTSEQILGICRQYFDNPYKISNQRIYETHTKSHLPWHTDNNLQSGNSYKGKHELPGLMFLLYLTDVDETNPFQLIAGSQKWSKENSGRFFTDTFIEQNYTKDLLTVRAPKGSLIVCNSHLVHRAEPFHEPGFKRLTYIFQVDELSGSYPSHGERLLVNTSFVEHTSPELLTYLGFGSQSGYPSFPDTSVATLLPADLFSLQGRIISKAFSVLARSAARSLIPAPVINMVRGKMFKKA